MARECGPMRVHHTAVSNAPWGADDDERAFRRVFAWIDRHRPGNKTASKFPHHELTRNGHVGPANVRACQSGIGILNGARGGRRRVEDGPARDLPPPG